MGQAYDSRASTIHDGNIITAAIFNNEYNKILNAFAYASSGDTGHQHDGTAGEGGNIHTIGDQDFLNKIVIESDEIKFFIEVGGASVEQLNLVDGVLAPETNNDVDLGTSSKRFKTIYATTLDVSTAITNAQLAGSIANDKLANSTVSYGGVSLALGASDATPAFDLSDATNYPTSSLSGTITNAQLAGSIANAKLSNSSVSFGGVSVALGASDATPAFDLSDATNYPTSSLSGTITNAQLAGSIANDKLAGSIANDKLANSSVSFGGVSVSLGASDATPAFDLTDATNYPTSSLSGTITNAQLAGSIANAKLSNSSVSYGGVSVALGASDATPAFDLTDATNYPTSSLSGTIATAQIADDAVTAAKIADDAVGSEHIEELSAELECGDQEVRNVKKLGIGFSGAPTYQLHLEDDKGATNTELVRIKNTGSHTGRIASFYKGSSHHGYIGLTSIQYGQGVYMSSQEGGLKFQNQFSTVVVEPCDENGADLDDSIDLGRTANRFDDIYATNSTIQTSDRNEKQDIAELTDAERRVAVAAKGLLRKFKWQSAVTEKGADARIHFGIIAQDLQAAFTAEGLDAGNYGMFISTTWWEHEGNKYYESQQAPEGSTTVTRLGVRYSELLAFIIAAL